MDATDRDKESGMSGWSIFVRQATALCLLLAVALAVILLTFTHRVQRLEEELGSLHTGIAAEQQKIHVLRAEFSFLAEPERLRRLASAHLGLVPVEPGQLATFATLDQALTRGGEAASGTAPAQGVHVASRERHR
jgi:cell division protein FtsL